MAYLEMYSDQAASLRVGLLSASTCPLAAAAGAGRRGAWDKRLLRVIDKGFLKPKGIL